MRGFLLKSTPLGKLAVLMSIAVTTTMIRDVYFSALVLLYVASVDALGGVPRRALRDVAPLAPLLVGLPTTNALVAWIRGGEPVAVFAYTLTMLVLLLSLSAMVAYTTNPDDVVYSLYRVSPAFALMAGLAYNTLYYLLYRARDVVDAYRARGLVRGWADYLRRLHLVAVSLLRLGALRAETLAFVLEMRGFNSPHRTYWREVRAGRTDAVFVGATLAYLAAAALAVGA